MNTRLDMVRVMLALLLAAGVFSFLFSSLLPPSASLLAPTPTLTPTATLTATVTFTPLPATLVTPKLSNTSHGEYFLREVWESAVDSMILTEDFEKEVHGLGELQFPYRTENGFLLNGNSVAQILNAPKLLNSGNLLYCRDPEQGLMFTFPDGRAVAAFGFDYTSSEDWKLTINNFDVYLPSGSNKFMGIIFFQNVTLGFTLSGPETIQDSLSIDKLSYVP